MKNSTIPNGETVVLVQQVIFKKIKITVADFVAIMLVLVLSVLVFAVSVIGDSSVRYCVIEINGAEWARYDMTTLSKEKEVVIDNEYGRNTVVLSDDGVWVSSSDCPEECEIKAGKITRAGQSLVCLPHKLVIRLEGGTKSDITTW